MDLLAATAHVAAGWGVWSLSHNLGHRWWHDEMRHGKQTFYAHGEREHHRLYDDDSLRSLQAAEDPDELFISFPLPVIAAVGILLVAGYGWLFGWRSSVPFAAGLYSCMVLDHRLHRLFHKETALPGVLGWFQRMHVIHHRTHNRNYFFVTGLVWDMLFRTAVAPEGYAEPHAYGVPPTIGT